MYWRRQGNSTQVAFFAEPPRGGRSLRTSFSTTRSMALVTFRASHRVFSTLSRLRASNLSSKAPSKTNAGHDQIVSKPSAADDPYPLPLQHAQHPLSSDESPEAYLAHPLDGLNGVPRDPEPDLNTQRARLVYQTRKRGTLETGLLVSTFATPERLGQMDRQQLTELDDLLKVPEWTLYYWGIGKAEPPEESGWQHSEMLRVLVFACIA